MDLRYALRSLAKASGATAVAVLTLALGIGINTVVFTLYESVVWKPLPVHTPQELVRVFGHQGGRTIEEFSYSEYLQLRDNSHSLQSMLATSLPENVLLVPPDGKPSEAEVARIRLVSTGYFAGLGVAPRLGRPFLEGESGVVVSDSFWKTRLHSDRLIVGKTIRIQQAVLPILGVAPESFAGTGLPPQAPDLWLPLSEQPRVLPGVDWLHDPSARRWQILARRSPGVSVPRASAELDTLSGTWPLEEGQRTRLEAKPATFFQADTGEFGTFLVVGRLLMIAVALILVIAGVNLVNLLLARNAARQREIGVRLALGAGRLRLMRQLCIESLILGLAGGAGGVLFSLWCTEWIRNAALRVLQQISSGALAISVDVSPDWRVFAYAACISLLTGAAVGAWPAIRASLTDVNHALKTEGSGSDRFGKGHWSRRNLLLTAQVTACLVLLAGAGLLFRGVWRSRDVKPGFDSKHVLLLGVATSALAPQGPAQAALARRILDRFQDMPEVASVAWADRPPFLGHGSGAFRSESQGWVQCLFNKVSGRYFETLGIPLVAGRTFTPPEVEQGAPVAIISESAARALWPGQNPLGRRITRPGWLARLGMPDRSYLVVGVVKDVRSTWLSKVDSPFLYFPRTFFADGFKLIRSRVAPEGLLRPALKALSSIDPNLPAQTTLIPLEQGSAELQRLMAEVPAIVSSILGLLALLLASIGIYGTVAYLVSQRTREIGIRMALGAQRRDVVRMVIGQSLRSVAWGAGLGFAGAAGLSAALSRLVFLPDMPDLTYGAGAFNLTTFLGILAVLTIVVFIASLTPLRRATRLDPAITLRNE